MCAQTLSVFSHAGTACIEVVEHVLRKVSSKVSIVVTRGPSGRRQTIRNTREVLSRCFPIQMPDARFYSVQYKGGAEVHGVSDRDRIDIDRRPELFPEGPRLDIHMETRISLQALVGPEDCRCGVITLESDFSCTRPYLDVEYIYWIDGCLPYAPTFFDGRRHGHQTHDPHPYMYVSRPFCVDGYRTSWYEHLFLEREEWGLDNGRVFVRTYQKSRG